MPNPSFHVSSHSYPTHVKTFLFVLHYFCTVFVSYRPFVNNFVWLKFYVSCMAARESHVYTVYFKATKKLRGSTIPTVKPFIIQLKWHQSIRMPIAMDKVRVIDQLLSLHSEKLESSMTITHVFTLVQHTRYIFNVGHLWNMLVKHIGSNYI